MHWTDLWGVGQCGTLDVDLYDHLIITDEGYSSLRELGLM